MILNTTKLPVEMGEYQTYTVFWSTKNNFKKHLFLKFSYNIWI